MIMYVIPALTSMKTTQGGTYIFKPHCACEVPCSFECIALLKCTWFCVESQWIESRSYRLYRHEWPLLQVYVSVFMSPVRLWYYFVTWMDLPCIMEMPSHFFTQQITHREMWHVLLECWKVKWAIFPILQ